VQKLPNGFAQNSHYIDTLRTNTKTQLYFQHKNHQMPSIRIIGCPLITVLHSSPTFQPVYVVAKWLPISATAELLLAKLQVLLWARCPPVTQPRSVKTLKGTEVLMPTGEDQPLASSFVEPQPDSRGKKIAPLPVSFKMVKNPSFCS